MAWKHNYEALLKRAYKSLPTASKKTTRFKVPKVKGSIQGNRTVVTNLSQIATQLRRPRDHLQRFLLRELATTGDTKAGGTSFIGKFNSKMLNDKIDKYVKEFVICSQCSKPDTNLKKEKGLTSCSCEACGAKSSVRTIK